MNTARTGGLLILITLGAGQFLITQDSAVMAVSVAAVATDLDISATDIQTAISLFALVMAAFMITGARLGAKFGSRRMFMLGCLLFAAGAAIAAAATNLVLLIVGWSIIKGIGAALMLPSMVALIAANFPPERRTFAFGVVAASAALAGGFGPFLGGAVATYASWRYMYFGEAALALLLILLLTRVPETVRTGAARLDWGGVGLSAIGLSLIVLGVIRTGEWGLLLPHPGAPSWLGLSPSIWLLLAGILFVWLFFRWEARVERHGSEPLLNPKLLASRPLRAGLGLFFAQYLIQAGFFFVVPVYLAVVLGKTPLETGLGLLPLSLSLFLAAVLIPQLLPNGSPRAIVRAGFFGLIIAGLILLVTLDVDSNSFATIVPMIIVGLAIGAIASQLGAVTTTSVPAESAAEVGGLQNTMLNLGSSLGTAISGALVTATLSTVFLSGIVGDPVLDENAKSAVAERLVQGVPFVSDAEVDDARVTLNLDDEAAESVQRSYDDARITALKAPLAALVAAALLSLFLVHRLPTTAPGREPVLTNSSA
ncbi:MFS transporter [Agromyces salentinus]|uniref:MFS transporter n=1 Tax=Agromyces salentinus TaxID=269421 RepID=UPI0012FAA80F|nr:MFS transporter [Agromyces salentinus]